MATNDQNIRLRLSAQTTGLSELQRVSEQLDKLEKSQTEFTRSVGTAGRTLADLERELKTLDTTARRLDGLSKTNREFDKQRETLRNTRGDLARARQSLTEYEKSLEGVTRRSRVQTAELNKRKAAVSSLETAERKASAAASKSFARLTAAGFQPGGRGAADIERQIALTRQLTAQTRSSIEDLPRREAEQKRITAQLEAQRRIVERRIRAERQVSSGFRQFSQQAEGAPLRALQRDVQERARAEREAAAARLREERRVAEEAQRLARDAAEQQKRIEREKTEALKKEVAARIAAEQRYAAAQRQASIQAANDTLRASFERGNRLQQAVSVFSAASDRDLARPQSRSDVLEQAAALQRVGEETKKVVKPTQDAKKAQDGLVDSLRKVAGQGRTTLSFFQRLRGQVLELAATYGSLLTAVTVAQQAIQTSIERTSIENRLLFANNNDAKRTAEDLDFVRQTADRLGQSYNQLATLYSRFAAASAAANQPIERTRRIFEQLTEAFTVLGLSQADVEGSFRALEQSISKGSVQAEELRGQLGDRFPGAVARFAKSIGVSVEELNKLLEAGRVSSAAIEFFAEDIAAAAKDTLPNATNSLQASLRRLQSSYQDFLSLIVESGFGTQLAEISQQLSDFFKSREGREFAVAISDAFSLVITAGQALIQNFGAIKLAIQLAIGVLIGRGLAAALAGTITLFGGLSTALVGARGALVGTTTAAAGTAVAFRGLQAALGPIAIVIGVLSTVLFEWYLRAKDAERAAAELSDEMQKLANARGEELIAARDSNAAQLEEIRNTRELIKLKIQEAEKRLAAAKAANEEAQRSSQAAARSGAPVRFGNLSASAEVSEASSALDKLREEDRKKADEERQRELAGIASNARIRQEGEQARIEALRLSAELEAELNDENNRKRLAQDDDYYNKFAQRTEEVAKLVALARGAGTLQAADEDRLTGRLDTARSARLQARGVIRPGSASDDRSGQAAADQRRREIQQLEEAAQEERERSLRDSLERLTEDEATAAEARVELIKLEYAEKIAEQQKFQQQAAALGQTALAAQFSANISALEGERENVIAIEQRETAVDNLRTKYEALNTALESSVRQRDLELERINTERELGLITSQQAEQEAERITREFQPQILANLQALRDFIEANAGALGKMFNVDEVLLQLDALQVKTETVVTAGQRRAQELKESFAQGASQALSSLGTGIADAIRGFGSFSDAIKGTRDAFLNFAADFLIQIGQMILQQAILNALQDDSQKPGKGSGGGGGGFGSIFQLFGSFLAGGFHSGGVIGKSAPTFTRRVPSGIFANAPRYHSGGIVGLKSDEVPAILQTGEEVLSRNNPRNAMNGGAGGANVQIVNAIDSASVVRAGLQGSAGREVITNIIQANKAQFRQILAS